MPPTNSAQLLLASASNSPGQNKSSEQSSRIMCEFLAGSLHACGHSRTRKLVHRCSISYYLGNACPLVIPSPKVWESICHECKTEEQREAWWQDVLGILREQSAAWTGRERAITRLRPLSPRVVSIVNAMADRRAEEALTSDTEADVEAIVLPSALMDVAEVPVQYVDRDEHADDPVGQQKEGTLRTPNLAGAMLAKETETPDWASEPTPPAESLIEASA